MHDVVALMQDVANRKRVISSRAISLGRFPIFDKGKARGAVLRGDFLVCSFSLTIGHGN